ncbi:MAG TPA: hypothetical protein PK156_41725 [Polyangium sp.]|nr:hypothetical protein [Polyangium sp.]
MIFDVATSACSLQLAVSFGAARWTANSLLRLGLRASDNATALGTSPALRHGVDPGQTSDDGRVFGGQTACHAPVSRANCATDYRDVLNAMGAWWIRKAPRTALAGTAPRILKAPGGGSEVRCR